jgi:hypothetical protein
MQPLYEVTLERAWHWGIAIVSAPGAHVPDSVDESLVTSGSGSLVIKVRHAQDVEAETFEGDWDWATATVHVRSLVDLEHTGGEVLYEGTLALADGQLAVGDADCEMTVNDLPAQARIRVHAEDASEAALSEVWLDLVPMPS